MGLQARARSFFINLDKGQWPLLYLLPLLPRSLCALLFPGPWTPFMTFILKSSFPLSAKSFPGSPDLRTVQIPPSNPPHSVGAAADLCSQVPFASSLKSLYCRSAPVVSALMALACIMCSLAFAAALIPEANTETHLWGSIITTLSTLGVTVWRHGTTHWHEQKLFSIAGGQPLKS